MGSGISPLRSKGRHRLHGLYPWASASRAERKNSTFRRLGFLAGHEGRQKIPVVLTAVMKMPS